MSTLTPPPSQPEIDPIASSVRKLQQIDTVFRNFVLDSHRHEDEGTHAREILKAKMHEWAAMLVPYQLAVFEKTYPFLDTYHLTQVLSNPPFCIPLRYASELAVDSHRTRWLETTQATLRWAFRDRPFCPLKLPNCQGRSLDVTDIYFDVIYRLTQQSQQLAQDQVRIIISILLACTTHCGIEGINAQIKAKDELSDVRVRNLNIRVPVTTGTADEELPQVVTDALSKFVQVYRASTHSFNKGGAIAMFQAKELFESVRQLSNDIHAPIISHVLREVNDSAVTRANKSLRGVQATICALTYLAVSTGATNNNQRSLVRRSHDFAGNYRTFVGFYTAGRFIHRVLSRTGIPTSFLFFVANAQPDWSETLRILEVDQLSLIARYFQKISGYMIGLGALNSHVFEPLLRSQPIADLPFQSLSRYPEPQELQTLFTPSPHLTL